MALKGLAELLKKVRTETTLTEDQVEEELNKLLPEAWIPKSKFNETSNEAKLLKQQLEETNKQLGTLKDKAGLTEDYKKQIDDLTEKQKTQELAYKTQLSKTRRDYSLEKALTGEKVRNSKAARALLDETKLAWAEDDSLAGGLKEQIAELKKTDSYLFETTTNEPANNPAKVLPSFGGDAGKGATGTGDALTDAFSSALGL